MFLDLRQMGNTIHIAGVWFTPTTKKCKSNHSYPYTESSRSTLYNSRMVRKWLPKNSKAGT